jgi:hypothetical protein
MDQEREDYAEPNTPSGPPMTNPQVVVLIVIGGIILVTLVLIGLIFGAMIL